MHSGTWSIIGSADLSLGVRVSFLWHLWNLLGIIGTPICNYGILLKCTFNWGNTTMFKRRCVFNGWWLGEIGIHSTTRELQRADWSLGRYWSTVGLLSPGLSLVLAMNPTLLSSLFGTRAPVFTSEWTTRCLTGSTNYTGGTAKPMCLLGPFQLSRTCLVIITWNTCDKIIKDKVLWRY